MQSAKELDGIPYTKLYVQLHVLALIVRSVLCDKTFIKIMDDLFMFIIRGLVAVVVVVIMRMDEHLKSSTCFLNIAAAMLTYV